MKNIFNLTIDSLDVEINGVARNQEGKVVFVRGALPGEKITAELIRSKSKYDVARVVDVLHKSNARVVPLCPSFGVCGGCSLQHLEPSVQIAVKQRNLEEQLWNIGSVRPLQILRAIRGPDWSYRRRARWSVRFVPKKGGALIGFHEQNARYVVDMKDCYVLPRRGSLLLDSLRLLINELSIKERLPQIEIALGDSLHANREELKTTIDSSDNRPIGDEHIALVFRVLIQPSEEDLDKIRSFGKSFSVEIWLQPSGPDSAFLFCDANGNLGSEGAYSQLSYSLPEFGICFHFNPTDFIQSNHAVNTVLVKRVIQLLSLRETDQVLDLFCGLGNFSLPVASCCKGVLGVEGSASLLQRALNNAKKNKLEKCCTFQVSNLFIQKEIDKLFLPYNLPDEQKINSGMAFFNKIVIDPPRDGALDVAKTLACAQFPPEKIIYVSCNPATLSRDAGILVNHGKFVLSAAGIANMFAHTAHVESIAVFDRVNTT